jgi:hypothetical protein
MTPTHANKKGVRYRYYVSQALLQGRKEEAGVVARVSAPNVEQLVIGALQAAFNQEPEESDRDLIQTRLDKAIVYRDRIEVTLQEGEEPAGAASSASTISIPLAATRPLRKGVSHSPARQDAIDDARRISLLTTIARSRNWIEAILKDPKIDFGVLAKRENLAERQLRFLAPLGYLSPSIIQAIAEGRAPADLTITKLARSLPPSWAEQEKHLGLD